MEDNKHTVGICAMEKKVHSKPMTIILENLKKFGEFKVIIFPEKLILEEDIESWPIVEALIVFFSTGFPYHKTLEYINLRKPFLVNDFESQKVFWDRREIKKLLINNHIPTPPGLIIDRGEIINNDIDSVCKIELNTSEEIEKMIDDYNNAKIAKSEMENANNINIIKELDDKDLIEKANKEEFYIDDESTLKRNLSISSKQSDRPLSLSPTKPNKTKNKEEDNNEQGIDDLFEDESDLEEFDEYIIYKGKKIEKPFVEKPANGDDHNVYIYYPKDGGQKRLFRKTKNLSSLYYPNENKIRRDKSYIYEQFLQSDGFDVKVYTVGEDFAHAEARKSPTLDGLVKRAPNGKEVRYPINLTKEEKEIARKIVKIFKQNVCGFDILRAQGKSYVCDVNGWSFVKGNKKYCEDCAIQIRKIILTELEPTLLLKKPTDCKKEVLFLTDSIQPQEELRTLIGIFRNADRAPKQEIKISVTHPLLLNIYYKYIKTKVNIVNGVQCPGELKLKKKTELLDVLNIVNELLNQKGINDDVVSGNDIIYVRLFQVKLFLEKDLNFEGMTRKIQIKPLKWDIIENGEKYNKFKITEALMIMKWGGHITHSGIEQAKQLGKKIRSELYPGEDLLRLHSTYRHDLKCYSSDEGRCLKSSAAFLQGLLEIDGSLIPIITSMVRKGESINTLLDMNFQEDPRKQVLTKLNELCNYNGHLIEKYKEVVGDINNKEQQPIIELINSIDNFYLKMQQVYELLHLIKEHFKQFLTKKELSRETNSYFYLGRSSIENKKKPELFKKIQQRIVEVDKKIKKKDKKKARIKSLSPNKEKNFENFEVKKHRELKITRSIKRMESNKLAASVNKDCEEENVIMKLKRYIKLYEKFYNKETKQFDISRIVDIFDNIKYDIIHNKSFLSDEAYQLYDIVSKLASFFIPLSYGITTEDKINIAKIILKPLLSKLQTDLLRIDDSDLLESNSNNEFAEKTYSGLNKNNINDYDNISSCRHVKTRFYFTSYPHLYLLLNTIKYVLKSKLVGDKEVENKIWQIFDLDYCSYIVFRIFENFQKKEADEKRYRVEILICPGADKDPKSSDNKHLILSDSKIVLNNHLSIDELRKYFNLLLAP